MRGIRKLSILIFSFLTVFLFLSVFLINMPEAMKNPYPAKGNEGHFPKHPYQSGNSASFLGAGLPVGTLNLPYTPFIGVGGYGVLPNFSFSPFFGSGIPVGSSNLPYTPFIGINGYGVLPNFSFSPLLVSGIPVGSSNLSYAPFYGVGGYAVPDIYLGYFSGAAVRFGLLSLSYKDLEEDNDPPYKDLEEDNDPPVISASVVPLPNADGWNNTGVTVIFECSDRISGIRSCPDPVRVDSEGRGQVISGTAVDFAGNTTNTSVTLNIDKTPPQIEIISPEDDFVTNRALVTVRGIIEDDGVDTINNVTRVINEDVYRVTVKTPIYEASIQVKNGEFLAEDVILSEGTNSMIVIGEDPAGNISISKINLIFNPPIFSGASTLGPPYPGGESLRILTYNTAFLSFTVDMVVDVTIDLNDGSFEGCHNYYDRATKIAQGILRGDQEVVILNEVFSETARNRLVQLLGGTYPHYISKLSGPPPKGLKSLNAWDEIAPFDIPIPDIPFIGNYVVCPGDSGLMIFSRFPFLPLTGPNPPNDSVCSDETCEFAGRNNGNSLSSGDFAFLIYNNCSGWDCFASKGVGLVKIATPVLPSYVAFTHLQASYTNERNTGSRESQYQQIKQLLKNSINVQDLVGFPVYVAGDLNTPGENKAANPSSEWWNIFHPLTPKDDKFFACGNSGPCMDQIQSENSALLTDSWGFETSVYDPGGTNAEDGGRFDYILHNSADNTLCMQHAMIAWELAGQGNGWYSDHYPLRVDFNKKAKWCSPNDDAPYPYGPKVVEFPDTSCDEDPTTTAPPCEQDKDFASRITYPGSFQWYKITQPGSYSIKITYTKPGEDVAYDVYHASDLSRPLSPCDDKEHPDWGLPFEMLEPPYYIRVYAVTQPPKPKPDRTAGNRIYSINFHQHLCRYPEDGCYLPPGAIEYPYIWPEITMISKVLDLYFKFETAGVRDGHLDPKPYKYPVVKLQQEALYQYNLDCMAGMTLEEYDDNIPPNFIREIPFVQVEIDTDNDWHDDGRNDERYLAPDLDTDTYDELKYYYVVMHRNDNLECSGIIPTYTRYETTLSYFIPGKVRCYLQADDSGIGEDDEMRFYTYFDMPGDPSWASQCDYNWCPYYEFDEPGGTNNISTQPTLRGYYVDNVHLDLHEEENNGPDILLEHKRLNIGRLYPWAKDLKEEVGHLGRFEYTDNSDPEDADYCYHMYYNKCHEKTNCRL